MLAMVTDFSRHLRAWRKHRKLTQAAVGEKVGVTHTTVGRWENNQMALTTENLDALAALYNATASQLLATPADAALVATLDRANEIIKSMDDKTREHWLAIGDSLRMRPQ